MLEFDHLAVSCQRLADGVDAVEANLGVALSAGGEHPHFGTHNRLLSLGGTEYLEVIAIDPGAPPPGRARWFGLDGFAGPPRLTNWILRCDDLEAARERLGPGIGAAIALERGNYRWRMAVPETGLLPFDNCHPALIRWDSAHPAQALPESGCHLRELVVTHPEAGRLKDLLGLEDPRIRFETGVAALRACIETPSGTHWLD